MIWATRGRAWGFRFIYTGGFVDPLVEYERAFSHATDGGAYFERSGQRVALRFLDPKGREDRSGRPIPHAFVLFDDEALRVETMEDGIREIWPLVEEEYERIWCASIAPNTDSR